MAGFFGGAGGSAEFPPGGVDGEVLGLVAGEPDWVTNGDGPALLSGSGAPAAGAGADGDFYIDTTNDDIYGPKTAGAWGSATSLVGPQGDTGATGEAGTDGTDGSFLNTYQGAWASGTDYAAGDLVAHDGSTWIAVTDPAVGEEPGVTADWDEVAAIGLQGEQGPTGEQGPPGADGVGVPAGGTAGQVLAKIDGTDHNTQWDDPTGDHDHTGTQSFAALALTGDGAFAANDLSGIHYPANLDVYERWFDLRLIVESVAQFVKFFVGGTEMLRISNTVLDVLSHRITNLADPTDAQDAATKAYSDDHIVYESSTGVWTSDAQAGRRMTFVGVDDPTDATNGVDTPANIAAGSLWFTPSA